MATWDETNPDDSDVVSDFPANERAARAALVTNFGIDHHETADANIGKHDKVTLLTHVGDPTTGVNIGAVYIKDVGGVSELFFKDEGNNVIQLTTVGLINDAALNGIVGGLSALSDPNADRVLFWDETFNTFKWLAADGTTISIVGTTLGVIVGGVDHDSLLNYSANQHVDHTAVTLTAGTGLTGGGDISASRSFALDIPTLDALASLDAADLVVVYDDSGVAHVKVALSTLKAFINATVALTEQGGDPAAAANQGTIYAKDVGGITLPFYKDSADNVHSLLGGSGIGVFTRNSTVSVTTVEQTLVWGTDDIDTLARGSVDLGTGIYTAAIAGTVRFHAAVMWDAAPNLQGSLKILLNGAEVAEYIIRNNDAAPDNLSLHVDKMLLLAPADEVKINVVSTTDDAGQDINTSTSRNYFEVHEIS